MSSCIKTRMSCFHYTEKGLRNNCTILHKQACSSKGTLRKKVWISFSSFISKNTTFYFWFKSFHCCRCSMTWRQQKQLTLSSNSGRLECCRLGFPSCSFPVLQKQKSYNINSQEMISSNTKGNKSWMQPQSLLYARTQADTDTNVLAGVWNRL